jgi:hypothetical protein
MKLKENNSGNFTPCPEYTGKGVCVDITPLKKVQSQYGEREVFKFVFETESQREDGSRHCVWSSGFTPSLHEKAGLRKFLRGWFGRDLTQEERNEFDTESLLGKPAFLVVTHTTKDNETYANIASCTPDKSGQPLQPSGKFVRAQDRAQKDGGGDYRRVEQSSAPAGASVAKDPVEVHGACKVHVGKCKGLELRDMSNEQVEALTVHWLPAAKANAKQSADDKRLIAALEWFISVNAPKPAAPPADDLPY